jgi:tRNA (adenine37-N6)-methyltransferase
MPSEPKATHSPLALQPIGIVRAARVTKIEAARQPPAARGERACIELFPGRHFEHALEDLSSWKLIWVLFWFDRNPSWRPKVLPPRSTSGRKGVFATRSPHRPNPIGLSAVRLERVDGLNVHILDSDMLDGTPVLDLKPYVAYTDSHAEAGNGWLDADPVSAYTVALTSLAVEQARWIEERTGLAIEERIRTTLALGPEPHPYRRIRRLAEGGMQLAVKEWRVRFSVEHRECRVTDILSGFSASQLASDAPDDALQAHREFLALWNSGPRRPS